MDIKTRTVAIAESTTKDTIMTRKWLSYLLDILLLLVAGTLLYYGTFWKSIDTGGVAARQLDAARYQCYTVAFWRGLPALQDLPPDQCAFITHPTTDTHFITTDSVIRQLTEQGAPTWLIHLIAAQSPLFPLHALPNEYPLINLLPFSLAALAPMSLYQSVFALLMVLVMGAVYFILKRFASTKTAYTFLLFLVTGCWGTALGRFDLIPSALTLIALLCAERAHRKWAFALLALAALSKLYPLLLLPPFLIAQQMHHQGKWYAWRRFIPLALFMALCAIVTATSLLLSVAGTLAPLSYFTNRPIQVESASASVLWLTHVLGGYPLTFGFSFGSRNMFSPLSGLVAQMGTILLVAGLLYTFWLQWRRKISLSTSLLLTLLIMIFTGKVFSAQYLIWLAPIIAYVSRGNTRWLLSWTAISLLTTLIYPFLYERASFAFGPLLPDFYLTILVRNILLLGFICTLLYCSTIHNSAKKAVSYAAKPSTR